MLFRRSVGPLRVALREHFPLFVVLLLTSFLCFIGSRWGGGYFFHPDENNIAWGISRLKWPNLNPHFFAYGQLSLYLVYFSGLLANFFEGAFSLVVNFNQAVYLLRIWSGIFAVCSVMVGYLLVRSLFGRKDFAILFSFLLAFSPGFIQTAHFGTTESALMFYNLALTYLSYLVLSKRSSPKLTIIAGLFIGASIATKISAVLFLPTIGLSYFLRYLREDKEKKKYLREIFILALSSAFFAFIFSPYNFLDWQESFSALSYEKNVALGTLPVFYTRQFYETVPVLFQFSKIFPWLLGLPQFLLFVAGLFFGIQRFVCCISDNLPALRPKNLKRLGRLLRRKELELSILMITPIVWFISNSFLFTKWTRFMIPILPFAVFLTLFGITRIFQKYRDRRICKIILILSLVVSVTPGLIFLKIYLLPDTREFASEWINANMKKGSFVLSEAGNVVDLPVVNKKDLLVSNFDFYSLEQNEEIQEQLKALLNKADYILIPSRRVFANNLRLGKRFPKTAQLYNDLFSGSLGFRQVESVSLFTRMEEWLVGSDLSSEETWTVFDHPTIRIFEKKS